ncbi:acyloxyacyl hydrolase [Alicycliphilus denitrificans]|uniref:acyloxyacyl hydrolase n=1 Tax=Alicycliphilus denitrificans TaxID=179636 RepID=UPI0038510D7C
MCHLFPSRTGHSQRYPYVLAAGLFASIPVCAQQAAGDLSHASSIYLQAGRAQHNTDAVTAGITLPWGRWRMPLWGGELSGHWDMYLSRWSFHGAAGHDSSLVLGVTPTVRLRPDQGRAAWFWEAGIGATLASQRYRPAGEEEFSTRFNFASHLGLGINLGAQRRHELLLRLQHVSNASIKQPNPGAQFVQLRYALHF